MRRALMVVAVLAAGLLLPAGASAHPGHAVAEVDVGENRYAPADIEIFVGDGINWVFRGPDTNHSITADPGQIETFDSDPDNPFPVHAIDDVYYHDFYGLGTYTYHCKVHPEMRGSVTVRSPQPPVLSSAKVKPATLCAGKGCPKPQLRVKVNHAVNIVGEIERHGKRWREVRELPPRAVDGGKSSVPLDVKGLRPGEYRAVVRARDDIGLFSTPERAEFEITKQ